MLCLQGNVESWLAELLTVTRLSVHDIIRSASIAITDTNFNLLEFEKVFPAQVCFFIVVYRRLLVISFIILISFFIIIVTRWLRCTVVERQSLTGEHSLFHARPVADG